MNTDFQIINIDPPTYSAKQKLAAKLLANKEKIFIQLYGSSRSGKTFLNIDYIFTRAMRYTNSLHLVARYSAANAKKTIWLESILPYAETLQKYKLCDINHSSGIVKLWNGSRIVLGGLEPSRINSVLAIQYATIFITEANENSWSVIETLKTRLNSTATDQTGKRILPKMIIDINPPTSNHWTYVAWHQGINPASMTPLSDYSKYGHIQFRTEDNKDHLSDDYIDTLKNLSPAPRKRFYEGEFGSSEGLVYQIEDDKHIVDDFEITDSWERGRAIDFGFTHPFVCLWTAKDPTNEVIYVYKEWVMSGLTVRQHANKIKELSGSERYKFTVADHDAEDRATLRENQIETIPANKSVLAGIDTVTDLLYNNSDRRPRLKIFRSCVKTINGFYSYRWKNPGISQKDREVVKEDDDEMDALRYAVMQWNQNTKRNLHRVALY